MCASRTSEHTNITTYRSQSFRCPSDLRIVTLLTNPNAVGAVLWCTHPNAICIPNRTSSSAETLDMDNPENLEILKILVQTDAVRFRVPFCIRPPFSPQTVRVCHCCTCARPAHLNTPTLQPTDPNPVGAVLRCTHPNAICIPNRTIGVNLAVSNYGRCGFLTAPFCINISNNAKDENISVLSLN